MCSRMHISAHALPSVVKYRGDLFERQEVCLIKATHEKKEQKTLLQYLLFLATYYWFSVFAILWAGHLVPGPLQKVMAFSLRLQTHKKQKDGCKKREIIHTRRKERKRKTIEKRKKKKNSRSVFLSAIQPAAHFTFSLAWEAFEGKHGDAG